MKMFNISSTPSTNVNFISEESLSEFDKNAWTKIMEGKKLAVFFTLYPLNKGGSGAFEENTKNQ